MNNLVPSNDVIGKALRRSVPMYPELAVRELVANALIHQDFTVGGAGPMIEIFADRMESSSPPLPHQGTIAYRHASQTQFCRVPTPHRAIGEPAQVRPHP